MQSMDPKYDAPQEDSRQKPASSTKDQAQVELNGSDSPAMQKIKEAAGRMFNTSHPTDIEIQAALRAWTREAMWRDRTDPPEA